MAPHFLTQILSIFSLGSKKKTKKADSKRTIIFNGKAHDAVLGSSYSPWDTRGTKSNLDTSEKRGLSLLSSQDSPPAYGAVIYSGSYSTHTLSSNDSKVQVCPHQMLDFHRFQRITNLTDFKTNKAKIDCLTPTSTFHHRGHDKDTKECQDSCKPLVNVHKSGIIGTLKGFGTYSWKNTGSNSPGLMLSFHWEMKCLPAIEVTYRNVQELQAYLAKANVQLCPHKTLHDTEIVNAIHPIVNTDGVPADPIDRYLAKQESKDCKVCGAQIKVYLRTGGIAGKTCRVDTKRYFGKGEERGDAMWVMQCKHHRGAGAEPTQCDCHMCSPVCAHAT